MPVYKMILLSLLMSILFLSCKKACVYQSVSPAFIGFLPSDIDTFIIRAYQSGDNFQHEQDTAIITNNNEKYTISNDTTTVYFQQDAIPRYVTWGHDWQIYIPAKNRTILIYDLHGATKEPFQYRCDVPIISFTQDSQLMQGNIAYIHN